MRIDSHQHFWRYAPRDYGWIDDTMSAIRRDFLPDDLAPLLAAAGLAGTVAVEARQSVEETEWLLGLAAQHPQVVRGVVGWLPLRADERELGRQLERLGSTGMLKGARHVLQEEPEAYFADPAFNRGVAQLGRAGLTYDLLIRAHQLPAALAFVDRHPEVPIVLDHGAKPVVDGTLDPAWVAGIRALAQRAHVCCKLSGLVTEAPGGAPSPALLRPYADVLLEAFGPRRLMFGSDWPVCLVASSYADWHAFVVATIAGLSADERDAILGGTAAAFYRLDPL